MSINTGFDGVLKEGQRAERKLLITVAEWRDDENGNISASTAGETSGSFCREILGTRTEDSSIEYNADISQSTDIRGFNYADINKTQPQQDFDPYLILGGSKLAAKLNDIRRRNALSELSDFNIYIVTAFINNDSTATTPTLADYPCPVEKHRGCTIAYTAMGGDANVNFPISVYFSNKITLGTTEIDAQDFLIENFTFTKDVAVG